MFDAKTLKDSVSPEGVRLTTLEVTFPRFVLAEFNTHRVFSRNSASSRAIPIHKQIERVKTTPFMPADFGTAQKGMVPGEALKGWRKFAAEGIWYGARVPAIWATKGLDWLGVHKSYANRLLEPWMWHTVIVSSTQWDNFFSLRIDEAAQGEIKTAAVLMREAILTSVPEELGIGHQHLPLVTEEDKSSVREADWEILSAGRCARVSFDRQHDAEDPQKSIDRGLMLARSGHWSPMEHQAVVMRPQTAKEFNGNFHGDWAQFRKMWPNEAVFRPQEF